RFDECRGLRIGNEKYAAILTLSMYRVYEDTKNVADASIGLEQDRGAGNHVRVSIRKALTKDKDRYSLRVPFSRAKLLVENAVLEERKAVGARCLSSGWQPDQQHRGSQQPNPDSCL